jgi:hypothetical protein
VQLVNNKARENRAAIRNVDLNTKVQEDISRSRFVTQAKRIDSNEYAIAASKIVDEFREQGSSLFQNKILKTALPLAPLLLLKPRKKGSGFQSFISDPRVLGSVLTAGVALFHDYQDKTEVTVKPETATVAASADVQLAAIARDRKGQPIIPQPSITWTSLDPNIASVDAKGKVTGVAAGSTLVTAVTTVAGKTVTQVAAIRIT